MCLHAAAARAPRLELLLVLLLVMLIPQPGDAKAKKKSKRRAPPGGGGAEGLLEREVQGCQRVAALLGDVSCERFLADYWERKPLISRGTVAPRKLDFGSAQLFEMLGMWSVGTDY